MAVNNAVASGAAILTTNADGLVNGLKKSERDIQSWGGRVNGQLSKGLGGKGGADGGGPGGFMGGKAGVAGIAVAGLAVAKFGGEVKETLADLDKMGSTARAMGLTAEQFTGMAGVAKSVGEDTREFIESLVTMGKLGTDAAAGTEQAAAAFKGLGIDANSFIKLRADEQFFQIFDSLSQVQDPLKRTRFLMQAFGEDGGKYLLPLLDKAPDEIRRMAKGFEISTEAVKKATAANQAWKNLQASGTKLWQNIAVGVAPLLGGIANVASGVMRFFQPAFDWLGRAFGAVQRIGGACWDFITDKLGQAWDWFVKIHQEAFGFVGDMPAVQDVVVNVFRSMGRAAAYAWDVVKAGAGVAAIGIGKVVGFVGDLGSRFAGTFKGIAELGGDAADAMGMTDTAKMFDRIGARANQIAGIVKGTGDDMVKWGEGAMNGIGKSADEFDRWLDGALAPKVADEVKKGMEAGAKEGAEAVKLSGAMLKGSKEAYSLVLKNSLRGFGSQDEPIKRVVKAAEKGNVLQKDGNRAIKDVKGAIDALGVF